MSLPSLAALTLQIDAPKRRTDSSEPPQRKKPKTVDEDRLPVEPNTIYYSANNVEPEGNTQCRLLSNLYGVVEWGYQKKKFAKNSVAHHFLRGGLKKERNGEWSGEMFKKFRLLLEPGQELKESYEYRGRYASGHLAQLMSILVTDDKGKNTATGRLARLQMRFGGVGVDTFDDWWNKIEQTSLENLKTSAEDVPRVPVNVYRAWRQSSICDKLTKKARNKKFLRLLREKFEEDPMFQQVLLSTGTQTLHEKPAEGFKTRASVYQYLTPNKFRRAAIKLGDATKVDRGGDLMGRLLMRVRDEIRSDEASCSVEALR